MKETITFDDVLLEPQYSDIESRSEVDIGSTLGSLRVATVSRPRPVLAPHSMPIALLTRIAVAAYTPNTHTIQSD